MYSLLADGVLAFHVAVVLFVIGGLVLVLLGNAVGWTWVNGSLFRWLHLCAIAVVVAESWAGFTCPLTTLENVLRARSGTQGMGASFIEYWFQRVLFYEAPSWIFMLGYTLFGAAVAWAWTKYPPARLDLVLRCRRALSLNFKRRG